VKKKTFAQKYMLLATKKPLLFYTFLLIGAALFLWLTWTTKIETADGTRRLFGLIFARAGKSL